MPRTVWPLLTVVILTAACPGGGGSPDRAGTPTTPTTPAPAPADEDQSSPATPAADATSPMLGTTQAAVWVAVEEAGTLVLVDLAASEVVRTHRTGDGPHNITVAADATVAAALYASTDLAIIRDGELHTVTLGGRPHDVKATDRWFVVANEAGRRIELVEHDGDRGARVGLRAQPHDLDVTADGDRAWVTLNGTDQLALVDLTTPQVAAYVPTGKRPHDIRIAPDGTIWITDWDGPVHVLGPDGEVETSIPLGVEAHHLAFTPGGEEAWVVDHATRKAYVVDTAARRVVAELQLTGSPHHVAITPDGVLAAIADHTNGALVVFDVARRERVATIPVGPGPHGVWALPAQPAHAASNTG